MSQELENHRWEVVRQRRDCLSSPFVYAVKTTGIYCRPGCPAKTPRRTNVRFFHSAIAAEQHGFRPCKRCQPRSPLLHDRRVQLVQQACNLIENAETLPSVDSLAKLLDVSSVHLRRVFKELLGATPKQFIDALRDARMRDRLSDGHDVTTALHAAGFGAASRFYERWAWILGMSPSAYGRGGLGELIVYAVAETFLGTMMVATTRIGVCSITFGKLGDLRRELIDRFPQATISAGDDSFCGWLRELVAEFEFHDLFAKLPLHVQGTAFMQRVWRALREIPSGETVTYSQLAAELGRPTATRAVASACAKNKLAVVIPCHRVIRNDGGLGGYRWGLERKERLLASEAHGPMENSAKKISETLGR